MIILENVVVDYYSEEAEDGLDSCELVPYGHGFPLDLHFPLLVNEPLQVRSTVHAIHTYGLRIGSGGEESILWGMPV